MSLVARKRRRMRRRDKRHATIYICGPGGCPPGECDMNGPGIEGTFPGGGGFSSATCSKCGVSAIDRAMWEGP